MATFRQTFLTRPVFAWAKRAMPAISETERAAIEAGDVWWDADLFTGNPDWNKLLKTPPAKLSAREKRFLAGPVEELCEMVDDWRVNWERQDLPPKAWAFIKRHKFFGMIIPQRHGGLGFSAYAQSEVIRKLSTRSLAAAVTVMVPNSLGPGELILQSGTKAQQLYWLPRLAGGREIPCFGLTSPEAGSDAASMTDSGVVEKGRWKGKTVLGIRLNWNKRYITLAPVATVLGLAFKLYDPDGLLGAKKELGITVALVPTNLKGVETGRRHLPALQGFLNGPTRGRDVFIPLDHIIGGKREAGRGWQMLMKALAAGRGISLPSLSAAGAALAARTGGAYARIRRQFGLPVGEFEGVQEKLGYLAANAYLVDAARRLTCAGLDQGRKLAVISAIMKLHATERLRTAINASMDIHGGKTVIEGPRNYLGNLHRAVPVAITVEGANILTRNLIVFGQGAIRCHPYLLDEMMALGEGDQRKALAAFDRAFWRHAAHSVKTVFRAFWRSWTGGRFVPVPDAGKAKRYYQRLARHAAAFALFSDLALLTLGGKLKRMEMISARLGDVLSELYLLSAVLKRFEEEGREQEDWPLVQYALEDGMQTIETRFRELLANFPSRAAALILKPLILPFGVSAKGPPDKTVKACARVVLKPSKARERLTPGIYLPKSGEGLALLEKTFSWMAETEPLRKKLKQAGLENARGAVGKGVFNRREARQWREMEKAVAAVVAVDDFAAEDLSRKG